MNNLLDFQTLSPAPSQRAASASKEMHLGKRFFFWFFLSHALLGFLLNKGSVLVFYGSIFLLLLGTYQILRTQNRYGHAYYFALYVMGLEVFLRMMKTAIIWEYGKYTCIYFLMLGLIFKRTIQTRSKLFLIYFYLLIPAMFLTDSHIAGKPWRELISLNLSGPLTLLIAGLYFYKMPVSKKDLRQMMLVVLATLITTLCYLIKNAFNLNEVTFNSQSNFQMSGGFGPNQVSTVLGFAVCLIFFLRYLNLSVFYRLGLDLVLLFLFLTFAFLTFSRGGVISALFTCLSAFFISNWGTKNRRKLYQGYFLIIISVLAITELFNFLDNYSMGQLKKRYNIIHPESTSKVLSGRDKLFMLENQIFKDNFLIGVGVGMSSITRKEYGLGRNVATHTEYTRLMAEHGLLGLIALFLLAYVPFTYYIGLRSNKNRFIFIIFILYAFLTMSHSAMRIALGPMLYGLAFIRFDEQETS